MTNDDDELASFLFPIERKAEVKPAKASIIVEEETVDVFALLTGEKKPAEQTDTKIETTVSLNTVRNTESTSIAQEPNISIEKKQRTPRLHYAHGKQLVAMEQSEIIERFQKAKLRPEYAAFFLCVDYTGARSSEIHGLTADKFKLTESAIEIEIFRKKHSAQTPNISLKRAWFGVDTIVSWYLSRLNAKPSVKSVYVFDVKLTPPSQVIKTKALWMFPHISKGTALKIAKSVYGKEKYVHYARLNRLTRLGSNPESSIVLLKSFSGIKSTTILERYLGVSQRQLDKAIDLIGADGAVVKNE